MASGSSQCHTIEQFMCGTPRLEARRQAHLLDTRIGSGLWGSHQMANGSSQARTIERFVCGMPRLETRLGAHLVGTYIRSPPWDSRQMASRSSHQEISPFVC